MLKLRSPKEKANLLRIYRLWRGRHTSRHATFILALSIYVMFFMIAFDMLFVHDSKPFILGRIVALILLFPALLLSMKLPLKEVSERTGKKISSCLLMAGPIVIHCQYYFYVFGFQHEKIPIYFTGLLIIIFYSGFVLHKFWAEQYLFNFFGVVASVPFAFLRPEQADLAYITIVCHLGSGFVFTYFRRDFVDNLFAVYSLLKIMVPTRVAEELAISFETTEAIKCFKPTERFTVCLCADWRGFQKMTATKNSDEISEMLEKYYDAVIVTLEKLVPTNNYYFNWTADELFIVFFSENAEPGDTVADAMAFAKALATEVFEGARRETGQDINFDIGIAAGPGLLGLQGPTLMKKTTITGEVAGRAKRFETEAKRIREEGDPHGGPTIVIDQTVFAYAFPSFSFAPSDFRKLTAATKDIAGNNCYFWTAPSKTERLVLVHGQTGS